jgi:hypothetical protein
MAASMEKVTLSLDRVLLEKMAKKAKKNLSQYVRDLIEREVAMEDEFEISNEILELKGLLSSDKRTSKERVQHRTIEKIRSYER